MSSWYNEIGKPLSSPGWLEVHHKAKLPERTLFAQRMLEKRPKTIVDIGCGTGLWLDLLNYNDKSDATYIGIDSDPYSVEIAASKAVSWNRKWDYSVKDIDSEKFNCPDADLIIAFNVFPYLDNARALLSSLKKALRPGGLLVVRQYDGALLRFGPLDQRKRSSIENSLQSSLLSSQQFSHFDLDRIYQLISLSNFDSKKFEFEIYQRYSPYDKFSLEYTKNMLKWTSQNTNVYSGNYIADFLDKIESAENISYFVEFDFVAWLS